MVLENPYVGVVWCWKYIIKVQFLIRVSEITNVPEWSPAKFNLTVGCAADKIRDLLAGLANWCLFCWQISLWGMISVSMRDLGSWSIPGFHWPRPPRPTRVYMLFRVYYFLTSPSLTAHYDVVSLCTITPPPYPTVVPPVLITTITPLTTAMRLVPLC